MVTIVRIVANGNSLGVTIPRPVLNALKLRRNSKLALEVQENSMRLVPFDEAKLMQMIDRPQKSPSGSDKI